MESKTFYNESLTEHNVHPVSYTHLDVYKRQRQDTASCPN